MTNTDFSTTPRTAVALSPVQFVTIDASEALRAAQHAGTLAYNEALAACCAPEECADAYHVTFADIMRELGSPMPCACDYCASLSTH